MHGDLKDTKKIRAGPELDHLSYLLLSLIHSDLSCIPLFSLAVVAQSGVDGADGQRAAEVRRAVFEHVRREFVPLDILTRYARALHPDFTALWLFRRQFTAQLAVSALATYVLGLNKAAPHALKMVATTGTIVPWELAFSLDSSGTLVPNDRVPFRLTPTLVNLATPVGISGVFSGCMVAGAQALADGDMRLADHVGIILRDEILSWSAAGQGRMEAAELSFRLRVNLGNIQQRVAAISSTESAHQGVEQLIKNSTATGNLCLMSPMWHPWL